MHKQRRVNYALLHWKSLLKETLKDTWSCLVVLITLIGSLYALLQKEMGKMLEFFLRSPWLILLVLLLIIIGVVLYNWPRMRAAYKDKKTDIWVIIECCDLLQQRGVKVIHMVDTFDTELGRIISPRSLHGAFLQFCKDKKVSIENLIHTQLARYKPLKSDQTLPGNKDKYALGTICPVDIDSERYCCVAFTKLKPNGTIEISKSDYIRCLKAMWRNLADPRMRGEEINVAVMGNRFVDLPAEFSTEQKIDLMIQTFYAVAREKACCRVLRICVHPDNAPEIDFEKYPIIIEHLAKRPII